MGSAKTVTTALAGVAQHCAAPTAPAPDHLPAGQARQLVDPSADEYVPGGQAAPVEQAAAPADDAVPPGHGAHMVEP